MKKQLLHFTCAGTLFSAALIHVGCADTSSTESQDNIDTAEDVGDNAAIKSDLPSIAFEVVDVGTPNPSANVRVVRSAARFQSVFGVAPPASIDFSTSWLAVYRTETTGDNQTISFTSVQQDGSTLLFNVQRELPDAECDVPTPGTFQVIKFDKPTGVTRSQYQLNTASFLCDDLPPPPGAKQVTINIDRNTWGDVVLQRIVDGNRFGDQFQCPADDVQCTISYTPTAEDLADGVKMSLIAFTASKATIDQLPTGVTCAGAVMNNTVNEAIDFRGVGVQICELPLQDLTLSVAFNKRDKEVYTEIFSSRVVNGDPTVKWVDGADSDPIYGRTFPLAGGSTVRFLPPLSADVPFENPAMEILSSNGQQELLVSMGSYKHTYTDVSSDGCVVSIGGDARSSGISQARLTDTAFTETPLAKGPSEIVVPYQLASSAYDCTHHSIGFDGTGTQGDSGNPHPLDRQDSEALYVWFNGDFIPEFDDTAAALLQATGAGSRYRAAVMNLGLGYKVLTVSSY